MHSFYRSRGRILFEVLCAFAISASCVGAWMQAGASALLPAAFVAALFGLVHAFDLAERRPAVTAEPQRIDLPDQPDDLPATQEVAEPAPAVDPQPTAENGLEEANAVEPTAPRARRAKAPRKGGGRRVKAPEQAKVSEPAPPEELKVTVLAPPEEPKVTELTLDEEAEVAAPVPAEDEPHVPLVPLFEPEPFARMQHRAFGRRGRI